MRKLFVLLAACGAPAAHPTQPTTGAKPVTTIVPHVTRPAPYVAPKPTDLAAIVGGTKITIAQLDQQIPAQVKSDIAAQPDAADRAYRLAAERRSQLDRMIDQQLLMADARGITVSDAEIDKALDEIRQQNHLTEAEMVKVIADAGMTLAAYRDEIRNQFLIERVLQREATQGEPRDDTRKRVVARDRAKVTITINLVVPPAPVGHPTLAVAALLSTDDVAATLKHPIPAFTTGPLFNEVATATYDSLHFKAADKGESFDLAIRVWKGPNATIDPAWTQLKALPNVVMGKDVGTESFRATEPGAPIFGIGFVDRPSSAVVLVTCGADLCKSSDETLAIARVVQARLDRLKKK
jgi:hypothetical protein